MPLANFRKMHGCGNSFLVALANAEQVRELGPFIPALCSTSFGLGSDGIMLIDANRKGAFEVYMYNPDGSPMGMCGNGIRCVARFVYEEDLVKHTFDWIPFTVEGRNIECRVHDNGHQVEVNMGAPRIAPEQIPLLRDSACIEQLLETSVGNFRFSAVSMGNPHCVVFTDNLDAVDLTRIGPVIEHHELFPRRTNVEFVSVLSQDRIRVRVWERGAGITLACGTGACASLVAAVLTERCAPEAAVELPGGTVMVRWDRDRDQVFMTGPASHVADFTVTEEFFQSSSAVTVITEAGA